MTTAKNIGRIDVWPDWRTALAADTEESKVIQKLTVWGTTSRARANLDHEGEGGGDEVPAPPSGFKYLINADDAYIVNADGAFILAKV